MKAKSITKLVLIVLVIAALICLSVFGLSFNGKTYISKASEGIKYGLDIAGGTSILYEAQQSTVSAEEASTVINIMRTRLDEKGYTEATITREGEKRFAVEIPDVTDTQEVVEILGTTAKLTFVDPEDKVIIDGSMVKNANANITTDSTTGKTKTVVSLEFKDEGTKAFTEATQRLFGQPDGQNFIAIKLDDTVISAPRVNSVINDSSCIIEGDFKTDEAKNLASLINSGNLPFELKEISSNTVDATLGHGALENAVKAGLISLIIIMLFMICFYRLSGFLASIALAFYTAIVVLILSLFHVNLTLSGIAGIVLSMGMAVDANVVIFERIIDELNNGKSVGAAVRAGFDRAMTAVIDSNVTTIITCIVLYLLGTGTVKGFAITLLIGVIVSMFTAIIVTKFLMTRMVELDVKNRKLYGFGVKA
ncbi:MAG: protein translocase subunit SecD [Ruminococcaceae bacterium]|nr:protein translocase subunit SecD [Oscillospiraceae bacterium]